MMQVDTVLHAFLYECCSLKGNVQSPTQIISVIMNEIVLNKSARVDVREMANIIVPIRFFDSVAVLRFSIDWCCYCCCDLSCIHRT